MKAWMAAGALLLTQLTDPSPRTALVVSPDSGQVRYFEVETSVPGARIGGVELIDGHSYPTPARLEIDSGVTVTLLSLVPELPVALASNGPGWRFNVWGRRITLSAGGTGKGLTVIEAEGGTAISR